MKGSHIVHSAAMPSRELSMMRFLRVSHMASAPMAIEIMPSPIMSRKDQKATISLGA